MIHLICFLIAAVPLRCAPQGDTASADPFAMSAWEMFKRGTSGGHLAYIRGNTALRALKERQRFPYRAGFAVAFLKPNRFGLPGDDEAQDLTSLENEIDRAMSGKRLGFLTLVITTGGMREYVFYSNQPDAVRKLMRKMGNRMHGREVRTYVAADPAWEVYDRFTQ
jgi:hypothetical protein